MIGYVEVELFLYNVHSLKEKRSILKRLLHKLGSEQNLAASELDFHDLWQRSLIGLVALSADKTVCDQMLQRALSTIDTTGEVERTNTRFEWL